MALPLQRVHPLFKPEPLSIKRSGLRTSAGRIALLLSYQVSHLLFTLRIHQDEQGVPSALPRPLRVKRLSQPNLAVHRIMPSMIHSG
jgi:hypothetical protein